MKSNLFVNYPENHRTPTIQGDCSEGVVIMKLIRSRRDIAILAHAFVRITSAPPGENWEMVIHPKWKPNSKKISIFPLSQKYVIQQKAKF